MLTGTIRNQIDQVWEMFWTGGVTNPLSVIEQISYLLFIRRLDEVQRTAERKAQATGMAIEKPIFSAEEAELRWSSFKDIDPDAMFTIVQQQVFPKIKNLQAQGSFADHMQDAIFMIPSAKLLTQVVDMLDSINMQDKDTKGDLYEYLLSKLQQSGVNGQFRTPRNIIQLMVELMQPKLTDTICDPASGTCGFLMAAIEYIEREHKSNLTKPHHREHFNNKLFTGYDFDSSMLRIGAMNMLLHGIENPAVHKRDSLQDQGEDNIAEAYSLILANPPFKGSVDFDIIAPDLLQALGKSPKKKSSSTNAKKPTEKSELLFLALILRLLKIGGRAAVIVPDGVLFGSTKSHKSIRQKIVAEQQLEAVISLPSGVFKPYAGVSTAILIFTKTNSGGTDKVWFYDMQADGYSLDDKRTPLTKDGETATHQQNNSADIIQRFQGLKQDESSEAQRKRTEQSFLVPLKEIEDNGYDLSLNRYKEVVYEAIEYDAPEVILTRIKDLQKKMADGVGELEGLL
jgi:type I restriction enzyme M protein